MVAAEEAVDNSCHARALQLEESLEELKPIARSRVRNLKQVQSQLAAAREQLHALKLELEAEHKVAVQECAEVASLVTQVSAEGQLLLDTQGKYAHRMAVVAAEHEALDHHLDAVEEDRWKLGWPHGR